MKPAALILALLLAGCGPSKPAVNQDQTAKHYYAGPVAVYEFELDDGSRCVAVAYAGTSTGIACQWVSR